MKHSYLLYLIVFSAVSFLPACESDKITTTVEYYTPEEYQLLTANLNLPRIPYDYSSFNFSSSVVGGSGTLGRVLFYDTNLSSDHTVSCGSCHKQNLGFADDQSFSKGIMNRSTARNALSLGAFQSFASYSEDPQTTLFWDGRVNTLHDQMVQTIRNPREMGMEIPDIVDRIKGLDYYKILTKKAFGTDNLNEELVLLALQDFMHSINTGNSKFDIVATDNGFNIDNNHWNGFTPEENLGKNIFADKCFSCHGQGLNVFSSSLKGDFFRNANNGLDLVYTDKGAGEHDPSPEALAIFKVPGLRNIALTAPYMHDGRFATLDDVLNFYSHNIQNHPNLNSLLKENGQPKQFNFTQSEKDALISFLNTLTDNSMVENPKWSDPFL